MFVLDPPPIARLPTPKTTQPSSKSKGYAFLEFTDKKALQQALRLHHSELEGRKINVELTAGGGGKSEHRVKKLQERNKGLHEQRVPHVRTPSFLYLADPHLSETSDRETQICRDGRRKDRSARAEGARTSSTILHHVGFLSGFQQQKDVVDTHHGRPRGVKELQETEAAGEAKRSRHRCQRNSSVLITYMYSLTYRIVLGQPRTFMNYRIVGNDTMLFVFSAVKGLEEERASSPQMSRGRMLCVVGNETQG